MGGVGVVNSVGERNCVFVSICDGIETISLFVGFVIGIRGVVAYGKLAGFPYGFSVSKIAGKSVAVGCISIPEIE